MACTAPTSPTPYSLTCHFRESLRRRNARWVSYDDLSDFSASPCSSWRSRRGRRASERASSTAGKSRSWRSRRCNRSTWTSRSTRRFSGALYRILAHVREEKFPSSFSPPQLFAPARTPPLYSPGVRYRRARSTASYRTGREGKTPRLCRCS